MTTSQPDDLEQLVRDCDLGWMVDSFSPKEQAIQVLRDALKAATTEAQRRHLPITLTEQALLAEYKSHSMQVCAFLQALGATRAPAMLVMVWRIIQGMNISQVQMSYEAEKMFNLRVRLAPPGGQADEVYESTNINDAALLRHFGIMIMNDKPLFDGFYALTVG